MIYTHTQKKKAVSETQNHFNTHNYKHIKDG